MQHVCFFDFFFYDTIFFPTRHNGIQSGIYVSLESCEVRTGNLGFVLVNLPNLFITLAYLFFISLSSSSVC